MGCASSTAVQVQPRYPSQTVNTVRTTTHPPVAVTVTQPNVIHMRQPVVNVPRTTIITQQYPPPIAATNLAVANKPQNKDINIEEVVKKFQLLNSVILDLEKKNLVTRVEEKIKQRAATDAESIALKATLAQLEEKTKKELQDVANLQQMANSSSISNFFSSQLQFDQQFSQEEEEYIQAKTEHENCYKKLIALQEESSRISAEIDNLKRERNDLLNLYEQVDNVLDQVFGGVYGSTLEDELETKTDQIQEKLRRIEMAMRAWKNSEAMTKAATGQLEFACKRWWDVQRIPKTGSYQMLRIQAITETRNYLIAAVRNLAHTQRNISPVKAPYCDPKELNTLNQAINFIFIDGMTRDRHSHAYQVYRTTHARSNMLAKWIETVIANKITTDLAETRVAFAQCRQSLRSERLRLMKEKVLETTGQTLDIDETKSMDSGIDMETESAASVEVAEVEKVEDAQNLNEKIEKAKAENEEEGEEMKEDEEKPSLDELAPPPSKNELFGDLDTLMSEYEGQQKALQHEQEMTKARQEANFKEKLRRRRSKKMRLEAQGIQIEPDNGPAEAAQS